VIGKYAQQTEAYKRMPDNVLFRIWEVQARLNEFDMPGPTRYKTTCSRCGQVIRDHREIMENGKILCKPCTDASYFYHSKELCIMEPETENQSTDPQVSKFKERFL
jgi:formylmethanofuran dehydrogenase subunit E